MAQTPVGAARTHRHPACGQSFELATHLVDIEHLLGGEEADCKMSRAVAYEESLDFEMSEGLPQG